MKTMCMNSRLEKGVFFGGEIEPGTFHAKNVGNSSCDCPQVSLPEDTFREDMEAALAPDSLVPPIETDVVF